MVSVDESTVSIDPASVMTELVSDSSASDFGLRH
mgnify:CR=1 FL=1